MRELVSSEEMRQCDRTAVEEFGIPSLVLMERAALSAAEEIKKRFPGRRRVLVAAGSGNNGGDGLAAGRLLFLDGYEVDFVLLGSRDRCSEETSRQLTILEKYGCTIQGKIERGEYDIVIDAVFGIGLSRKVEGKYAAAIDDINHMSAFVCSLDIPSGIHADSGCVMGAAIKADLTVTFAFRKPGLILYPGCGYAGTVVCRDIGITPETFRAGAPSAFMLDEPPAAILPERRADGNKGTFGKALLVAGSRNMSGACILCGESIYRAGAGMVKIVTPEDNRIIVQQALPEALLSVYGQLPDAAWKEQFRCALEWADVIVAGPGLGMGENARRLMERILTDSMLPLVVDADGLNLLADPIGETLRRKLISSAEEGRQIILTPHVMEFARLAGCSAAQVKENLLSYPLQLAEEFHCTVVCKDAKTVVADSAHRRICVNTTGNNAMATAGSGDVLAGIIGGLLAQGMKQFEAACAGVYLHGMAGERAAGRRGTHAVMARDIIHGFAELTGSGEDSL